MNKARLLLNAKQHAQAIVDAYASSDEFYLLNNDFRGIQQRALNKEQFSKALNAIEFGTYPQAQSNLQTPKKHP